MNDLDLIDLKVRSKVSAQLPNACVSYFHTLLHTTSHLLLHFLHEKKKKKKKREKALKTIKIQLDLRL